MESFITQTHWIVMIRTHSSQLRQKRCMPQKDKQNNTADSKDVAQWELNVRSEIRGNNGASFVHWDLCNPLIHLRLLPLHHQLPASTAWFCMRPNVGDTRPSLHNLVIQEKTSWPQYLWQRKDSWFAQTFKFVYIRIRLYLWSS